MRFKEDKQKFSGELKEYINNFIANYNREEIGFELSTHQKLSMMN